MSASVVPMEHLSTSVTPWHRRYLEKACRGWIRDTGQRYEFFEKLKNKQYSAKFCFCPSEMEKKILRFFSRDCPVLRDHTITCGHKCCVIIQLFFAKTNFCVKLFCEVPSPWRPLDGCFSFLVSTEWILLLSITHNMTQEAKSATNSDQAECNLMRHP